MKDVYISLTFFLLSALGLCGWAHLGYRCLLIGMTFNEPGAGGAGMVVGALWGMAFLYLCKLFRDTGRESARAIEEVRAKP